MEVPKIMGKGKKNPGFFGLQIEQVFN